MSPTKLKEEKERRARLMVLKSIIIGLACGILGIILYACQAKEWRQFFSIIGVALVVAIAGFFSGGLLGFLFGIPQTQSQTPQKQPQTPASGPQPKPEQPPSAATQEPTAKANSSQVQSGNPAAATGQPEGPYHGNTNLEQISDWLSKILVGAGLTQIAALPKALNKYAGIIAPGLGDFSSNLDFSVGLLIFFPVCGFLVGYLWTRLHLLKALNVAEAIAAAEDAAKAAAEMKVSTLMVPLASKVSNLEEQKKIDDKALSLVQRQLNPGTDTSPLTQDELNETIKPASIAMRSRIFFLAQETRSQNLEGRQT